MTPVQTPDLSLLSPTCPLCHTVAVSTTFENLRNGATWRCPNCGQPWTSGRLDTVAAYAAYVASH